MSTSTHCWIWLCVCILASRTACSFLVSQTPELKHVSVGDTVKLKCTFEQKVSYCYSAVVWQKLNLRTGKLTPVMSGSHQHDEKTCVLTLTNVGQNDSGLYYCISHHNSMAIVGSGSRVIVTDHSVVEPVLSILYSVSDTGSSSVALQCLVTGVDPSQVQVFWRIGEKTHVGSWTEFGWTNSTDSHTEFKRAHLSISADEWTEADEIQCFAEYNGINTSKTLMRYETQPIFSWLLYAGCVAALLTILISVMMAVGLYRDMSVNKKNRGLTRKDAHRKISYGKQNTMREESSSVMCFSGDLISQGQDTSPSKE
ncbi:immunoglobulin kappa light chain-like isoform X2 [Pimephales promelas]|uniref:immunoglobulin kappa light chain-like isoform X2 n=1 Tax=Pimephales promelas TaxID=90988 RepID=UPI001955B55B|nr:immunoglobulin kappa light chain-like isoform X2 [Pimephales promelas]